MCHGLLHLTLDVPSDDQLLDWANTIYKPLAGYVTFFEDDRKTPRETLSFAAGQCVSYHESFVAGDGQAGAYVCQLSLVLGSLWPLVGLRRHLCPQQPVRMALLLPPFPPR